MAAIELPMHGDAFFEGASHELSAAAAAAYGVAPARSI